MEKNPEEEIGFQEPGPLRARLKNKKKIKQQATSVKLQASSFKQQALDN